MTFRQIGQIALDGVSLDLQRKIERAVEGSAREALTLRSAAGKGGGSPGEEEGQQAAFALGREGTAAQAELVKRTASEPAAKWYREVSQTEGETTLHVLPTIGRSIVTANRTRRPTSAVIIDLAMYRAQRRASLGLVEHQVSPFRM